MRSTFINEHVSYNVSAVTCFLQSSIPFRWELFHIQQPRQRGFEMHRCRLGHRKCLNRSIICIEGFMAGIVNTDALQWRAYTIGRC